MTIILFSKKYQMPFKSFYENILTPYFKDSFFKMVSYSRFLELRPKVLLKLHYILKSICQNNLSDAFYIDSSPLSTVKNPRKPKSKFFKNAKTSKNCFGWHHGFKIHLITDNLGNIVNFKITAANVDDRVPVLGLVKPLKEDCYLVGDKGYVKKELSLSLAFKNIKLLTFQKKGMNPKVMSKYEKHLLSGRKIIETAFGSLKEVYQIAINKSRSIYGAVNNILSSLIAYELGLNKMAID